MNQEDNKLDVTSDDTENETASVANAAEEKRSTKHMAWFVVHTYSGFELKVKQGLEERVKSLGKEEALGEILVPSEVVVEMVQGKKRTRNKKFFPGYVLVQMEMNEEMWHIVKNTPKVTGFVGNGNKPSPVPDAEVASLTKQISEGSMEPKFKASFEKGENVRVTEGPFQNFNGVVDEVKPDKSKLRVLVSIFGRSTPVELDFSQVEKN